MIFKEKKNKSQKLAKLIEFKIYNISDIQEKYILAKWLGRFLTVNNCEIYQLNEIELHLAKLTKQVLNLPKKLQKKRQNTLHIASEIYVYGGHTRLIKSLANVTGSDKSDLLITRNTKFEKLPRDIVEEIKNIFIIDDLLSINVVLQTVKNILSYRKIILHIHPDDIETSVALIIAKELDSSIDIYFLNHSDHTFSFGMQSADIVLEISGYGWDLRKSRGIEDKSSFLGLPISSRMVEVKAQSGLIVSGGSGFKFKPLGGHSLKNLFFKILAKNHKYRIILIGPSYLTDLWILFVKLRHPLRFRVISRMDYADYIRILNKTSLYIDSYPVTGGTAFTEALINGLPVLGLSGGPNGYGLADCIRVSSEDDFIKKLVSILEADETEIKKQALIREYAKNYHSSDDLLSRYQSIVNFKKIIQPHPLLLNSSRIFGYDESWGNFLTPCCPGFRNFDEVKCLRVLIKCASNANIGPIFSIKLILKAVHAIFKR